MTKAFYNGYQAPFTYTKGFFCDTSVASTATSGCEAGEAYKPPAGLVCVDHPGSIDRPASRATSSPPARARPPPP